MGQKPFLQVKSTVGRQASECHRVSVLHLTLSPNAVVGLGVGLGRGQRCSRQEVRVPLCPRQGTSLGAPGAFGQSPFSQPPAAPHQK